MATKKQDEATEKATGGTPTVTASYEIALKIYTEAVELLRKHEYAAATERFQQIEANHRDEAEMAERARTYSRICHARLREAPAVPVSLDDCYYQAVLLSNQGRAEEAVGLLDKALVQDPTSVKVLYARACAWALQGYAERAVSDLRSAISIDPTVRFQATNDSDFERVREEPSFIDVIEPTPAGA